MAHSFGLPPAFILLMVGIPFLCSGLGMGASSVLHGQRALRAEGEVVALNAGSAHFEVRFVTAEGETIEYPQSGFVSQQVGDHVTVLYLPSAPHSADLDTFGARFGFSTLFLTLGTGMLCAVGVSLVQRRPGPDA